MRLRIKEINEALLGKTVVAKGWVRTIRAQKSFSFIELNDGSTLGNLQVVAGLSLDLKDITTGAAIAVEGEVVASPSGGQQIEIKATKITLIGACCPEEYPLQKKRHSFEFLRTIAHLRPRTNTIGAISRVRNTLAFATHQFFQSKGFLYVNTPIITLSDCEGAGELFRVTTLDLKNPPRTKSDDVDFEQDFFAGQAYLTVSGQLNAEIYCCALTDVYTFGPTFRAENSNTSRHLAEFWMIEPEMAFADLNEDMLLAESYLQTIFRSLLNTCEKEMDFFDKFVCQGVKKRLEEVAFTPFERVSYTEAIDILIKSKQPFEFPVKWGMDFQAEHERFLCEKHFKKPLIVYNYPLSIKPFYMRVNDDEKTVANMDILVPGVGEIIGGSQREERLDVLERRMDQLGMDKKPYWWYIDLRKYGSTPHAGFGLGFERLVLFTTGMENIRDAIPFPRFPGNAAF